MAKVDIFSSILQKRKIGAEMKQLAVTEAPIFLLPTWHSKTGFLNPRTTDILSNIIVVGGCPMHYRKFGSVLASTHYIQLTLPPPTSTP